jgi:hypothetical protein
MPPRTASRRLAIRVPDLSRRGFIGGAASIGGGLMLGIYLPIGKAVGQESAPALAAKVAPPRAPSAFLHIASDDTITLVSPSVEMGQGGHTALPMILMEELGGDWKRLKVEDAPAAAISTILSSACNSRRVVSRCEGGTPSCVARVLRVVGCWFPPPPSSGACLPRNVPLRTA